MFNFPKNLYTDVRIEDVFHTDISYTMMNLDELKVRKYKAAFIRIFDGERWYYSSVSDVKNIQNEIDKLSSFAKPNETIDSHPIVKRFEVNTGEYFTFKAEDISKVSKEEKIELLKPYFKLVDSPEIKMSKIQYIDERKVKQFYSSKGANIVFDTQRCGFTINFNMVHGDKKLSERFSTAHTNFESLKNKEADCEKYIEKCKEYLISSSAIDTGKYTVILSPVVAGVFAHESFGHKSESDFMVGDENMKKEWAIGTKVGSSILSIVDDGNEKGSGYIPFDDEGTKAKKTYLIKDGVLTGRLHSASTAADLEEGVTGNARAKNFEYEPIVRMTSTYIDGGDKTVEELIAEVEYGIFVDTFKHGSGMSTFTIAPNRSYLIENGKITKPVNVSVITGSIFETLGEIDGVSKEVELLSFVTGGCGKMEQFPLPVGFGGPYVRVKNMNIR